MLLYGVDCPAFTMGIYRVSVKYCNTERPYLKIIVRYRSNNILILMYSEDIQLLPRGVDK